MSLLKKSASKSGNPMMFPHIEGGFTKVSSKALMKVAEEEREGQGLLPIESEPRNPQQSSEDPVKIVHVEKKKKDVVMKNE